MVVLMCFNCEHLLVGRTCVEHHTKACCAFGPPTWHHSNSPAPKRGMNLMHRWINCDNCMRQQNLAGRFKTSPFAQLLPCITAPLHWARLFELLVSWAQTCAMLKTTCRLPLHCNVIEMHVLSFLR